MKLQILETSKTYSLLFLLILRVVIVLFNYCGQTENSSS